MISPIYLSCGSCPSYITLAISSDIMHQLPGRWSVLLKYNHYFFGMIEFITTIPYSIQCIYIKQGRFHAPAYCYHSIYLSGLRLFLLRFGPFGLIPPFLECFEDFRDWFSQCSLGIFKCCVSHEFLLHFRIHH